MNFFKDHEISVKPAGFNTLTDVIPVNKRISISSIAAAADLDINELLLLNPSFKKEIINGSALTPMPLVLPSVKNSVYTSLYDLFNGSIESVDSSPLVAGGKKASFSKVESSKGSKQNLYYVVKAGDTLSEIAKKKGTTVSKLKDLNRLEKSIIKVGMRLKIN
ncbi:MAG: LysM peptidoglycan-binding domain-containing protein [Bacteroidetes bacterium]|nr:LysM peptidoglycan-binding domain-containing protein [Bacteroidota bacterium]